MSKLVLILWLILLFSTRNGNSMNQYVRTEKQHHVAANNNNNRILIIIVIVTQSSSITLQDSTQYATLILFRARSL